MQASSMSSSIQTETVETDAITQYLETTFGEDNVINEVTATPEPIILTPSDQTESAAETDMAAASSSSSMDAEEGDMQMNSAGDTIFIVGEVENFSPLFGSDEGEFIAGRYSDSILFGFGGDDTLVGDLEGEGNDELFAGSGNDEVLGNDGNDILFGEEGEDNLIGGAGDDYLRGGADDDNLFGGTGTDIFAAFLGEGNDVVFDFEADRDIIGLGSGLTFDQLTLTQEGRTTVISLDGVRLISVLNTTATNFTQDTFLSV